MTPEDARKLLGGYATGSLTEAERAALFEAALEDQDLCDELAGEQALKEVLDEPGARQRLIAALEPPTHRAWLWVTAAATVAVAVVIGIVVSQQNPAASTAASATNCPGHEIARTGGAAGGAENPSSGAPQAKGHTRAGAGACTSTATACGGEEGGGAGRPATIGETASGSCGAWRSRRRIRWRETGCCCARRKSTRSCSGWLCF